jgi:hypothetical protein
MWTALLAWLPPAAMLALLFPAGEAAAQIGDEFPGADYHLAVQAFYSGEYRDAEQELRRAAVRASRSTLPQRFDLVCYHAMLGEMLYHQGRNTEALTEFDRACQYIIATAGWMSRVNFQQDPQPDANPGRRIAPWGPSARGTVPGQFPRAEQVAFGQLDPTPVLQRGGVLTPPEYRRVNVMEIVRTSALAIRRRAELLGPLAPHDQVFKELSDRLSRGGLAPPSHWSSIWVDLERGLVQAALGKVGESTIALNRATTIGGQLDHPLTGVALLEQGRLALLGGNGAAAGQALFEASLSAYAYENWDVLTESLMLGWLNHLVHGGAGVYPPLEPAAAWAQANRLNHIAVKLRLAQAESLLWLGQEQPAAALLAAAERPLGQMGNSLAGIHHLYLRSVAQLLQGRSGPGGEFLGRALAAQAGASLRNFQIGLTGSLFDSGGMTPRVAVEVYQLLLADPTPAEWVYHPLDAMTVLKTPHDASFDRWFLAALERKEVAAAIEVAERAKRRRFLASLPLGGRLVALRAILEAPERELSHDALLQRQQLLTAFPPYRELAAEASQLFGKLHSMPLIVRPGDDAKATLELLEAWGNNAESREQFVMQLAVRRVPSSLEFPPFRRTEQLQKSLTGGAAIILFHAAAGQLYGFSITANDAHSWKMVETRRLRTALAEFLQELGNYSAGRQISVQDLRNSTWQKPAVEIYKAVFADSRLDGATTAELVIVPDDLLWYLPFEALVFTPANAPPQLLADRRPIRYGPTAALVVGDDRPVRRTQRAALVGSELNRDEAVTGGEDLLARLERVVAGPVRLAAPLPASGNLLAPLFDDLIVLDDIGMERAPAGGWSPLPRPARGAADSLVTWLALPQGGPQRIVLTSFVTEAEQGLKTARRANAPLAGSEIFLTACNLMASGARTILLSRWRTSGRVNFDLVREFMQEVPHTRASEAWQRAVLLARESPLDVGREPRMKRADNEGDPPTANHPFFWAGYQLIDTGAPPQMEAEPEEAEDKAGGAALGEAAPAAGRAPALPPPQPPVQRGGGRNAGGTENEPTKSGDRAGAPPASTSPTANTSPSDKEAQP